MDSVEWFLTELWEASLKTFKNLLLSNCPAKLFSISQKCSLEPSLSSLFQWFHFGDFWPSYRKLYCFDLHAKITILETSGAVITKFYGNVFHMSHIWNWDIGGAIGSSLQGVKGPWRIMRATKNFSSETVKAKCLIFHRNAPRVVLSQVCSNGLFSINFGRVMGSWIYSHMPKQLIFAHSYKDLLLKNHWAKFFNLTHECLLYVDNSSLFKWSWFIDLFWFYLGKAKNN